MAKNILILILRQIQSNQQGMNNQIMEQRMVFMYAPYLMKVHKLPGMTITTQNITECDFKVDDDNKVVTVAIFMHVSDIHINKQINQIE